MKNGRLRCVDYTMHFVEQRARYQHLNTIVYQDRDELIKSAKRADADAGSTNNPLHGIPILLKDNINTRGVPTTACTPGLLDHIPAQDAPLAARLFAAGGLLLGKANMHELAFGATNNGGAFGAARNPYDENRVPGGSSGGSAAAVAAGIAPAAIGSDTAGSVRLPAALCGIVGFRPTVGRYPAKGMVPLSSTRDTAGPMCRSMADIAALDGILAGQTSFEPPPPAMLRGMRLGVPQEFYRERFHSEVEHVFEATLDGLRRAGVTLVQESIPGLEVLVNAAAPPIIRSELTREMTNYLEEFAPQRSLSDVVDQILAPEIQQAYRNDVSTDEHRSAYRAAMTEYRPQLQKAFSDYLKNHRLSGYVVPAAPSTAPLIGEDDTFMLCGQSVTTVTLLRNTSPSSVAGNPSLVVPAGLGGDGLPVGLMLESTAGQDRPLIALGCAVEAVLGAIAPPPNTK